MKFYNHSEECCNKILAAFEAGKIPETLKQVYIHKNDGLPCNKWSASNQFLTALAGTQDARGFHQWKEAGRKVKKGEKAFYILIPLISKHKETTNSGEEKTDTILYGFSSAPVFGIESTEIFDNELWEKSAKIDVTADSWVKSLPLYEVAEAWDINVMTYSGSNKEYLGYFTPGKIALGVENYSTWAHELNHAADYKNGTLESPKMDKEIVAELGGSVLLKLLGFEIDADLGGCWEYINRFAKTEKTKTLSICMNLLKRVCNNVSLILDKAEEIKALSEAIAA